MNSIKDFKLVQGITTALGIDLTKSKAKLEEQVKTLITTGSVKVTAPTPEEVKNYMEWLDAYEVELENNKSVMTIPEMEEAQREINKVAAIVNRIALDSYNVATAKLKSECNDMQGISQRIGAFSSIYDEAINEVKAKRAAERIEFLKAWTVEELKGRDVYEFAHDWDLYYIEKMTTADGSVNRGKEGNITTPAKDVKEHILSTIANFEKDKKAIQQHEYSSVVFDYYVKNSYDLVKALELAAEYQRLEEKRKAEEAERERLKAEREEADRLAAEEAERKRVEEVERAFKSIKINEELPDALAELNQMSEATGAMATAYGMSEVEAEEEQKEAAPKPEEIKEAIAEQIAELDRRIYYENMANYPDRAMLKELEEKRAALQRVGGVSEQPKQETKQVHEVYYKLTTYEVPETALGSLLKGANVQVKARVEYDVSITSDRANGFQNWLNDNNIEWRRV